MIEFFSKNPFHHFLLSLFEIFGYIRCKCCIIDVSNSHRFFINEDNHFEIFCSFKKGKYSQSDIYKIQYAELKLNYISMKCIVLLNLIHYVKYRKILCECENCSNLDHGLINKFLYKFIYKYPNNLKYILDKCYKELSTEILDFIKLFDRCKDDAFIITNDKDIYKMDEGYPIERLKELYKICLIGMQHISDIESFGKK